MGENSAAQNTQEVQDAAVATTFITLDTFKELYSPITNPWDPKSRYAFQKESTPKDLLDKAALESRLWHLYIRQASNNDDVTTLTNEAGGFGLVCFWITEKPVEGIAEVLLSVYRTCEECEASGDDCESCESQGGDWIDVSTHEAIVSWEESI